MQFDANGDGMLSRDELMAFAKDMANHRPGGERPGGGRPGGNPAIADVEGCGVSNGQEHGAGAGDEHIPHLVQGHELGHQA